MRIFLHALMYMCIIIAILLKCLFIFGFNLLVARASSLLPYFLCCMCTEPHHNWQGTGFVAVFHVCGGSSGFRTGECSYRQLYIGIFTAAA